MTVVSTRGERTREIQPGLLTAEQAAAWLNVSRAHFYKLKLRRVVLGPQVIRYDLRDLQAWADANGDVAPMRSTG